MKSPVVFLHGFENEELLTVVRAVKKALAEAGEDPGAVAFASSTPNNIDWTVKDLIREVREEHDYMKKNPPVSP
ncbi:DUF3783 domain-containing protein [Breznakiella homolactica]|uniref:DUF3783 domain-containing protein n=1 Tax=Breznakiella homolactica TaxID=2798577 RepID=A0A7T7XQB4_9SPIR|nr:DUF3783 domain-containing protein [Breznakiella homolactica]QQO10494.1 DUF3783 domain-containing protein [Breznakiella homolactica]